MRPGVIEGWGPLLAALLMGATASDRSVRLPEPDYLSAAARNVLRTKMAKHREATSELVIAVALLDYGKSEELAGVLTRTLNLDRPLPDESEGLGPEFPMTFFVLQDELKLRATAVKTAASARKSAALASAFGRMMETCVSCHAAYLRAP